MYSPIMHCMHDSETITKEKMMLTKYIGSNEQMARPKRNTLRTIQNTASQKTQHTKGISCCFFGIFYYYF